MYLRTLTPIICFLTAFKYILIREGAHMKIEG